MSQQKDSLSDRMKRYEGVPKTFLTRRIPVVIRLDGKAFHTFTKGFDKPFDPSLLRTMQNTMKYLCENIQGCVLGYTQSDEITLVLTDYATITTDAWFGYNVQKMVSVSAGMATLAFNRFLEEEYRNYYEQYTDLVLLEEEFYPEKARRLEAHMGLLGRKQLQAVFDSRVFSLPKEEVCNCLIWRQQDAIRNSIEALGQANFSPKELHKKTCSMILDMLREEKNITWSDYPTDCQRGSCCYKRLVDREFSDPKTEEVKTIQRNEWFLDTCIPVFQKDRDYIERLL